MDADQIYGSPAGLIIVGIASISAGFIALTIVPDRAQRPLLQSFEQESIEKEFAKARAIENTSRNHEETNGSAVTMNGTGNGTANGHVNLGMSDIVQPDGGDRGDAQSPGDV